MATNDWGDEAAGGGANDWGDAPFVAARPGDSPSRKIPPPAPPRQLSSQWLTQKLGEGLVPGFNRLAAGAGALFDVANPPPGESRLFPPTLGERYTRRLQALQGESRAAQEQHPIASMGVRIAGGAPLATMTGGGGGLLQGLRSGAALGGAYAAGESEAPTLGGLAGDVAAGAGLGGALGGALGALAPSVQAQNARLVMGQAQRAGQQAANASARKLLAEGVPLTPGQRNPAGAWSQLEEASSSIPVFGPSITKARLRARQKWADVALNKAVAPESGPVSGETINDALKEAYGSFGPVYSAIKGELQPGARPLALAMGIEKSAQDPNLLVTDQGRKMASQFLTNRLSVAKKSPTVEAWLKAREGIREEVRKLKRNPGQASEILPILENAEDSITSFLAENSNPLAAKALAETDKQYAIYKTLEDAVGRAGDQIGGMTPSHLSAAVKARTPPPLYARGGGGELRQWARAGKETLDARVPETGVRGVMAIPVVRYPIAAAAAWRANAATSAPNATPGVASKIAGWVGRTTAEAAREAAQLPRGATSQAAALLRAMRAHPELRIAPTAADQEQDQ